MSKFNLVSSILESSDIASSSSYAAKMDGLKVSGGTVKKVPGIRLINATGVGKLYAVYYMIVGKSNLVFRVTSKQKNFSDLHSLDLCNSRWLPIYGIEFRHNPPQEKLYKVIDAISSKAKAKAVLASLKMTYGFTNLKQTAAKLISTGKLDTKAKNEGFDFVSVIPMLIQFAMYAMILVGMLYYYYRQVVNYATQIDAETSAEKDINEHLFSKQQENDPAFALYADLISFIKNTVKGPFPATIICGQPGTGKTYILRRTFHFMKLKPRSEYKIEKGGSLELIDVFSLLYEMRKGVLVLDDYDTPLKNADTINFLKSITDSYKRRIISMPRAATMSSGQGGTTDYKVPQKFEYSGKIIIITNLERKNLDKALLSRCPSIEVNFSVKEMIASIKKMYDYVSPEVDIKVKKEVLEYLLSLYKKDKNIEISFRTFQNSVGARTVSPNDWKDMVKIIVNYKGK